MSDKPVGRKLETTFHQPGQLPEQDAGVEKPRPGTGIWPWLSVLLFALVLVLLFLLWRSQSSGPEPTEELQTDIAPLTGDNPSPAERSTAEGNSESAAPADAEAVLAARQRAQVLLAAFGARLAALESRRCDIWAASDCEALRGEYEQAQSHFSGRRYELAEKRAKAGVKTADALIQRGGDVFAETIDSGDAAYNAGDMDAAEAAYKKALTMVPDSKIASAGLQRVAAYDQLQSLLKEAEAARREQDWPGAVSLYQEALAVDPLSQSARLGLNLAESQMSDQAYGQAIAATMLAIDEQRFDDARAALKQAQKLRPGAVELGAARAQLQAAEKKARIEAGVEQVRHSIAAERWPEADRALTKLATVDPSLELISELRPLVDQRLALDQRLQGHIEAPQRLSDPRVLKDAEQALNLADAIDPKGDILRRQMQQLARIIARAKTPRPVRLLAQPHMEVLVYRVGQYKDFEVKQLSLRPGNYTIVTRCEGHRDRRGQLQVESGSRDVIEHRLSCGEAL